MDKEHEVSEKVPQDKPGGSRTKVVEPEETIPENTVLADTEGKELIEDLLADIDLMYTYARRRGISLSPGLLDDISQLMARTGVHREVVK